MRDQWRAAALGAALFLSLAAPGWAQTLGPLSGDTAAQGPWTAADYGRFDTSQIDGDQVAALAGAAVLNGPLRALGSTVTVSYLGTGAARNASLYLADLSQSSWDQSDRWMLDTREGYSYADYLNDPFGYINTVGQWRQIGGLSAGDSLVLGLKALMQTAGDTGVQSSSIDYLLAGEGDTAHVLQLEDGRLLLGFEDEGSDDWADAVFLIDGADIAAVPEPASLGLVLLGLAAGAFFLRRRVS